MDAADEVSNDGPLDDGGAEQALERGRWLFAQTCTFLVSAAETYTRIDRGPKSPVCKEAP